LSGGHDEPGILEPLGAPWNKRWCCVGVCALCLHLPLCLLKNVQSLKFTSTLSISLSTVFVLVTLALVVYRLGNNDVDTLNWLPHNETGAADILETLPVLMILYVCQYLLHPVFSEMRRPTEQRMRRVVRSSLILTTCIYWLIGLAAYLLFTDKTLADVLINYGKDLELGNNKAAKVLSSLIEHVVKIGYALAISCTFPLIQVAVKENVFDLLGWGAEPALVPNIKFVPVTVLLVVLEYVLSIIIPDISIAFAILGSTVAIFIAFIMPALVGFYGSAEKKWSLFLLIFGVSIGITCFSSTIYVLSIGRSVHA